MGTIISLLLPTISKSFVIYKYAFQSSLRRYTINYIFRSTMTVILVMVMYYLVPRIIFESQAVMFVVKVIFIFIFVNMGLFLCNFRSTEFKEIIRLLSRYK